MLIEELRRCGVTDFVISPGSRSTPLALAVAENPKALRHTHFDERGAAFFALGLSQGKGRPAALVCTSGSAVANYLPAVVEAAQSHTPLILLTADRPPELLDCGANQAIVQPNIFGAYTRWSGVLPCPTADIPPAMVLTTADHAFARATQDDPGPVHLNCMFREPFVHADAPKLDPPTGWQAAEAPHTRHIAPQLSMSSEDERAVINLGHDARRGILVVGRLLDDFDRAMARQLAEAIGWPVYADVSSGLRLGDCAGNILHHLDPLLASDAISAAAKPDTILHLGGPLVSKRVSGFLAQSGATWIHVAPEPARNDPHHCVTHRVRMQVGDFCAWLAPLVYGRFTSDWFAPLCTASAAAAAALEDALRDEQLSEPGVARCIAQNRPEGSTLYLGNSLPVREMDIFAPGDAPGGPVLANRGASGIDGNIATAAGHATTSGKALTALIGDLTALHDLNSLALLQRLETPFVLVVLNNGGGGIFSFLPVAEATPHFEEIFGTPHEFCFEHAAKQFGLAYAAPDTADAFDAVYASALACKGPTVIEVKTDRAANLALQRALQKKMVAAAEAALT